MYYSDLTIQTLRTLPIFDVCSKLGITLYGLGKLTKRAKCWYHDDTHPSMHVNKQKNIYKCFVCGKGGDVIRLVQDYENLTFSDACAWLIKEFSVTVIDDNDCHPEQRRGISSPALVPEHVPEPVEGPVALGSAASLVEEGPDSLTPVPEPVEGPGSFLPLPHSYVTQSLSVKSTFCQSLVTTGYLTEQQMLHAADRYHLGISKDGGVVFWEIDDNGAVHNGKIMYYQSNCHRDKSHAPTWVVAKLKKSGVLPQNVENPHCLFGLHLLTCHPEHSRGTSRPLSSSRSALPLRSSKKGIAIVESEKSAIILSELFPDYTWLASGGKTMLNASLFARLGDRRIILFPDTDETGETYRLWQSVAQEATKLYKSRIHVSSLLELKATPVQKSAKIDIVDFLYPNL
jgi:hypothetical protein